MSALNTSLLVDGAVVGSAPLMQALRDDGTSIALYADLPEGADQVGPWIWPGRSLASVAASTLAVQHRHGVSQLEYQIDTAGLVAHLQHHRLVSKPDGSSYYLRFADMRTLAALREALAPERVHSLMGPVHIWSWIDRYGARQKLERSVLDRQHTSSNGPLMLSKTQLNRLDDASTAERLATALAELDESGLCPDLDPAQFRHVEEAAIWLTARRVSGFRLTRAVARQAVLSHGAVLNDPRFTEDVSEIAAGRGDSRLLDIWTLRKPTRQSGQLNA